MRNLSKIKASAVAKCEAHGVERNKRAELVKDSCDKNRQFFAIYLGLWVYVLLMVFATTDQMLLVPTQGIKLPFVDVTLPLLGFYVVAPLFLLAIHFNLLQNLESHHHKLMRWREACGGTVPRQEIPAFLFDFEWLERDSKMEGLVRFVSRILFLHSGPFALGILMWRFTDYQDITLTSWHLSMFVADSMLVWLTDRAFRENDQSNRLSSDWPSIVGRLMGRFFVLLVLLQFVFACWFHFSTDGFVDLWSRFDGRPNGVIDWRNRIDGRDNSEDWLGSSALKIKVNTPWLHSLLVPIITIDPNEDAWMPDLKKIETQSTLAGEERADQWWKAFGAGLNLTGRHLRGFSAPDARLPKLNIGKGTDLQGAYLRGAQLQGAKLGGAQLKGANLESAQLQGAFLSNTRLQGANLKSAHLQGAKLDGAQLQGAYLGAAQLQGAMLNVAQLQEANLEVAQLQGAFLAGAQLQGAYLHNANMQGANLMGAKLQGANLAEAGLQGAVLDIHEAYESAYHEELSKEQLQPFQEAQRTAADLRGANLVDTNLSGVYLQLARLQGVIVGSTILQQTRLPRRVGVVYKVPPFAQGDEDWQKIVDMAQSIPSGSYHDAYVQRIEKAKLQKKLTESEMHDAFPNQPQVVWESVIKDWDGDSDLTQENLLVAARGLKRNYTEPVTNKRSVLSDGTYLTYGDGTSLLSTPDISSVLVYKEIHRNSDGTYHLEYRDRINQAFCASKRLLALCK